MWEEPRLLEDQRAGRPSYRTRRRLKRLRPPTGDPVASPVWSTLDADEQAELLRIAADGGTADVAHRAVVVVALQRQIECRESRLAVPGIVVSLAVVIVIAVLGPAWWAASSWGIFLAALGGGASGALVSLSKGRRANERIARRAGYQVGGDWGAWWGFDRPVTGDPLFGTSLAVTGLLWLLWPTLGEGVPPVVRASLLVPFTLVLVGLVLTTARGLVRRARGS